jgi:hypothetical protein
LGRLGSPQVGKFALETKVFVRQLYLIKGIEFVDITRKELIDVIHN